MTDKLASRIKERFDHVASKQSLNERVQKMLTISYNGGMFKITPELFATLATFHDSETLVLPDAFGNPILVDTQELLYKSKLKYKEVTNEWLAEYDALKQVRSAAQI